MRKSYVYSTLCCVAFGCAGMACLAEKGPRRVDENRPDVAVDFEVPRADRLEVVSEPACHACRQLKPVLERLQREGEPVETFTMATYPGSEKISLVPTLLFYRDDQLVKKHIGYMSYDRIKRHLD